MRDDNSGGNHGGRSHRSILGLSNQQARSFLLKHESYCTFQMPPYMVFENLLGEVDEYLGNRRLSDCYADSAKPWDYIDVNHRLLGNKDGMYSWRPLTLIHPALYVSLVHQITQANHWETICKRFLEFDQNDRIECLSLPLESLGDKADRAEQVSHWWRKVEQKSIELSLQYEYLLETDVTDCYGALYTHSVPWALHTKDVAKDNRDDKDLVGNLIDWGLQAMRHGQTNGIPQGSVLMDLIAEMVLGYADLQLSNRISELDGYQILRYRDDYRIFVNNPQTGQQIMKYLTETMIELGLKLNPLKTRESDNIIQAAIKDDKISWMRKKQYSAKSQKHLLLIFDHSLTFPNSGTVQKALADYHERIIEEDSRRSPLADISIVAEIAYRNPRTYPVCTAILSKLLNYLPNDDKREGVIDQIQSKFAKIPNTGHMEMWLQRITRQFADIEYTEPICQLVETDEGNIWDNQWIASDELIRILDPTHIIDREKLEELDPVIPTDEIDLFGY